MIIPAAHSGPKIGWKHPEIISISVSNTPLGASASAAGASLLMPAMAHTSSNTAGTWFPITT